MLRAVSVLVALLCCAGLASARCRQPTTPTPRTGPTPTAPAGRCSGSEAAEGARVGLTGRWCLNATSTRNNLLEVSSVNRTNVQCGTASIRLTSPSGKVYTNGPSTQPGTVAPWERGTWSLTGSVQDDCSGRATWTVTWVD